MDLTVKFVFELAALAVFLLAAIEAPIPRVNLLALGLALALFPYVYDLGVAL